MPKAERSDIFMALSKELQDTKDKIKSLQEEQENYEKQLVQFKNRERKIRKIISNKERKKRTCRLIERGAILESFIEGASEKSNEEIKDI